MNEMRLPVVVDPKAEHVAAMLYSQAVYELATGPETLKERIRRAYAGQAVHANRLLTYLPHFEADQIAELHMMLGQGGSPDADPNEDALMTVLDGLDDDGLRAIAEHICIIASDLVAATAPYDANHTKGAGPFLMRFGGQ